MAELKVETLPLADLKPHPRNYRKHPEDQIAHLVASIEQYGFFRNIVIARDGTILAGHGVALAAARLDIKEVPCVRLPVEPDSPQALKVLAADNEIARLAEVDDRWLTEILREIKDTDSLLGTGFDDRQLAALLMVTRPMEEIADEDEAAAWVGMPEFGKKDEEFAVVVKFSSKEDRLRWVALIEEAGVKTKMHYKAEAVWSTWWPPRERDDLLSVKFEAEA